MFTLCTQKAQYGMIGVPDLKISFPSETVKMQEGDIVVCYTDGATETENSQGEQFGAERLSKIIQLNKDKASTEICSCILESLKAFAGSVPFKDDITTLVFKRTKP